MKRIKIEIELNIPNNLSLNNRDDILEMLINFPHKSVFIDGKVI